MKKLAFRKKTSKEIEFHPEIAQTVLIPISEIGTNPYQPRRQFDEVDIVTLADSIRQHGLLQPITVRFADSEEDTAPYLIIAGERRFRAMQMLSFSEVPCLIVDISAREAAELAIIENIMRKDLTMFELAEAIRTLLDDYELTQEELGKRLSTSQSNIANKLRLLRFTEKERILISEYKLSERHARAILRIQNEKERLRCICYVGENKLTVNETEDYVDKLLLPKTKAKTNKTQVTHREACDLLQNSIQKPLLKLEKRGVAISSEQIEENDKIRIVITIPKTDA